MFFISSLDLCSFKELIMCDEKEYTPSDKTDSIENHKIATEAEIEDIMRAAGLIEVKMYFLQGFLDRLELVAKKAGARNTKSFIRRTLEKTVKELECNDASASDNV